MKWLCYFRHKWVYVKLGEKDVLRYCQRCNITQEWDESKNRYIFKNPLDKG